MYSFSSSLMMNRTRPLRSLGCRPVTVQSDIISFISTSFLQWIRSYLFQYIRAAQHLMSASKISYFNWMYSRFSFVSGLIIELLHYLNMKMLLPNSSSRSFTKFCVSLRRLRTSNEVCRSNMKMLSMVLRILIQCLRKLRFSMNLKIMSRNLLMLCLRQFFTYLEFLASSSTKLNNIKSMLSCSFLTLSFLFLQFRTVYPNHLAKLSTNSTGTSTLSGRSQMHRTMPSMTQEGTFCSFSCL